MNDTDVIANYEFQDNSEIDEHELFAIDNGMVDDEHEQPTSAKRAKHDTPLTSEQNDERGVTSSSSSSKPGGLEKSSALCEFDIFGNYVAAVMKNMRKNDARQLQMKIVQLINSYDEDESVWDWTVLLQHYSF